MRGARREIEEERAVRPDRLRVVHEADGPVHQVLGQVVSLFGAPRLVHRVIVVDQLGMELVGLAVEEAVEPVEAALERPLVIGTRRRGVLHLAQMPLADRERRVPLVAQHLGHRRGVVRDVTAHVREAGAEVRQGPHPDLVMVPARQQGRPGRGAERCDVEVGVPQAVGGELVDVRRADRRAVAAKMGEAGVIEQDHDHVRRIRPRMAADRPGRLRLGDGVPDDSVEACPAAPVVHRARPGPAAAGPSSRCSPVTSASRVCSTVYPPSTRNQSIVSIWVSASAAARTASACGAERGQLGLEVPRQLHAGASPAERAGPP